MKKEQSETDLTKAIRKVLSGCGVWNWKQWQGPMSQPKGVSDIIGIKTVRVADLVAAGVEEVGVFTAIEVKKPGWRPPGEDAKSYRHYAEQKKFVEAVRERGGLAFFATSIDEVIDAIGARSRFLF
jgi:hypothetical protein